MGDRFFFNTITRTRFSVLTVGLFVKSLNTVFFTNFQFGTAVTFTSKMH